MFVICRPISKKCGGLHLFMVEWNAGFSCAIFFLDKKGEFINMCENDFKAFFAQVNLSLFSSIKAIKLNLQSFDFYFITLQLFIRLLVTQYKKAATCYLSQIFVFAKVNGAHASSFK